jgi:predicted transcriptional regulator
MHPPPEPQPRQRRYRVRHQARLDAETHAKLEALACTFRRKRAAILRYVMQWALAHAEGWTVDHSIPSSMHLVTILMDPELLPQVQAAAAAHGASMATWVREAVRQVTPQDFPDSWHAGDIAIRPHDSGYFHRKFGLRLDEVTSRKLGALTRTFDRRHPSRASAFARVWV